jgi:uncharacterized membrane protein
MSRLVVLAYADEFRGAEVLATLERLRTTSRPDFEDAACVVRRADWTVLVYRRVKLADEDECCTRFWRGLVASLILTPGAASGRETTLAYGIEPDFERRLTAALPPGGSAVLMIVTQPQRSMDFDAELECFGGTLLVTPIASGCGGQGIG